MQISAESFPHAPHGWTIDSAKSIARKDGLPMSDDLWQLVGALQDYYGRVEHPKLRQIKDALDEKFHTQGGMKYLYQMMPSGPVAEGCKLAGLNVPAGAVDKSFGSVA